MRRLFFSLSASLFFLLTSASFAYALDLAEYVAGANFTPHILSTGEQMSFSGDGGQGPGQPVRQFKNNNYEQFFISGDAIYRREDTSWAPRPGVQDAHCADGSKAVYTLDPKCQQYSEGQQVTGDGARWAPRNVTEGQSWSTQAHQIVSIKVEGNNRFYCSMVDFPNNPYVYPKACNQTNTLQFKKFHPANSYTFCTGIKNEKDMVELTVTAGAGLGDLFFYMKGFGLVGFEDPGGFQSAIVGEGSDSSRCGGPKNPLNPASNPAPKDPQPVPYVPCADTRPTVAIFGPAKEKFGGSEFHSLRPYQASPCNPKIEDITLYCGNDVVVKKTYRVLPGGADRCEPLPDGGQRCYYEYDNQENTTGITINLEGAELPIIGNTEDVENQYNNGFPATFTPRSTRLNEYVSWYLNGTNQRAEHETINANTSEGVNNLVNFSGPLKKLLPERVQREQRLKTIAKATSQLGLGGDQTSNLDKIKQYIPVVREVTEYERNHNQIVGCLNFSGNQAQGDVIRCSADAIIKGLGGRVAGSQAAIRLSTFLQNSQTFPGGTQANIPPFEEDFRDEFGQFDFFRFWTQYKRWLGETCAEIPAFGRVCFNNPLKSDTWGTLFSMIPFSGTEDRLGTGSVPNGIPELVHPPVDKQPKGEVVVSNVQFQPDNRTHKLYFAHMKEVSDLSDVLQNSYIPKGVVAYSFEQDFRDEYETEGCEIVESRTNPGDNLFGSYNQPIDSPISDKPLGDRAVGGSMSYTSKFTCDFPPLISAQCLDKCVNVDKRPIDECTQIICPNPVPECKRVSHVAMNVYTKIPLVEKIWQQLVSGSASFFKRIYPKTGPGMPIEEIKDLPAQTKAQYGGGGGTDANSSVQILAGNPGKERDGSAAEIFFPHIGGIYDYFLKDIQKALRPKGLGDPDITSSPDNQPTGSGTDPISSPSIACPTSIPSLPPPSDGIACVINCQSVPDSDVPAKYLGSMKARTIDIANRWVAPPNPGQSHAAQCYNDVVKRSVAAGVNPLFTLAIWVQESAASNYTSRVTFCDASDPVRTVQDFGINNRSFAGNFDSQLKAILRLPYLYPTNFSQCFPNGQCSLDAFSLIYQQGVPSSGPCVPNSSSQSYTAKTRRTMGLIQPGCQIAYPTDMSCP